MSRPKEIHVKRQCYFSPNIHRTIEEYATKNHLSYANAVEVLAAKALRVKIVKEYLDIYNPIMYTKAHK